MRVSEIRELDDEALLELSLKRGGKYNCYTPDALKAQKIYGERKGGFIGGRNDDYIIEKKDRSYYSDRYYSNKVAFENDW